MHRNDYTAIWRVVYRGMILHRWMIIYRGDMQGMIIHGG